MWLLLLLGCDADIRNHQRVQGELDFTLSFDADARASGLADCTYSRTFEGPQVTGLGYLCAACEIIAEGTSVLTDGADCLEQLGSSTEDRTEWWGLDASGAFYRSSTAQYPLAELSLVTLEEGTDQPISWSDTLTLSSGSVTLTASGTVRHDFDPTVELLDPFEAAPTYSCGWPQGDPGDLPLDYEVSYGSVMPNVVLTDQCGEDVALWDFHGAWVVLDSSQSDCGPCQNMASGAEDFVAKLRAEGIDIYVISLLGNGLDEPWGTPTSRLQSRWVSTFDLTDPVLADRGYAFGLFPDAIAGMTGESFGYPAWLILDPQMRIAAANVGFSNWDDVADFIRSQ